MVAKHISKAAPNHCRKCQRPLLYGVQCVEFGCDIIVNPVSSSNDQTLLTVARSYVYGLGATFSDLEKAVRGTVETTAKFGLCPKHKQMVETGCLDCEALAENASPYVNPHPGGYEE